MKNYSTVTITQLDTGYLIESAEQRFALTSNDTMIAKVRELLNIPRRQRPSTPIEPTKPKTKPDETTPQISDKQKYGIITPLIENGKWPIKKSDYLVPELISIPNNEKVKFAETSDKRIVIEYDSGRVFTTWDEITDMFSKINKGSELLHVPVGFSRNQRTCIRQFMIAIRKGLRAGDSIHLDPDKEFRKQLDRSSQPEYESGTLKEDIAE